MVEDITVPSGIVGLLIGKSGSAHQRLQMISGARIYIAPDPPNETGDEQQQLPQQQQQSNQQQQQQKARSVTITGISCEMREI